ncbi:MAG: aminomethyl-transferring glycine dehydrogenase, partial [Gammaproteobacteria bacterium]
MTRNIDLESPFVQRHLGISAEDQAEMLALLGVSSIEELIEQVIPESIRAKTALDLPTGLTEEQALSRLKTIAAKNQTLKSYIGQGYYGCHTPAVILRNLLENPAWYTAYTPYQPEISQGRLEALLNFQTMVADLTGMPLANASLLDEATAAAEAMTLCRRMSKSIGNVFFVDEDVFPQTLEVIQTRAKPLGIDIVVGNPETDLENQDFFGVLIQYPGACGQIRSPKTISAICDQAHERKALVAVAADLLALTLLKSPGSLGADIALGSSQRFGVSLGFGGPHAAYMATQDAFKRSLPGRVVGVSIDADGNQACRLALQTREQHIRREKATSNICTAQVLLAVIASMYAVYHGADGLKKIARRVHQLTTILAEGVKSLGFELVNNQWFDTLSVHTGSMTTEIHLAALDQGINLRQIDSLTIGLSIDETTEPNDIEQLLQIFALDTDAQFDLGETEPEPDLLHLALTPGYLREDDILTHEVFNRYHTETEMMRYLRRLADKDIALDRSMIPLGSCTMKLNAAAEMIPVTWEAFANMHPFAPLQQAQGYLQMITELEEMLCKATGYSAISLQPNAGSQGEYAGLLAIQAWHQSRGEGHRNVCLIPSSAHGTNPASAQM